MVFGKKFGYFLSDESGAVTVDWVALVAMLVLIGIAVAVTINSSTSELADAISADIDGRSVWTF